MSSVRMLNDEELEPYNEIIAPTKKRLGFVPNSQRITCSLSWFWFSIASNSGWPSGRGARVSRAQPMRGAAARKRQGGGRALLLSRITCDIRQLSEQ